jgi:hypothetical protein
VLWGAEGKSGTQEASKCQFLSFPFLLSDSLLIEILGDARICMAQEFLCNLDVDLHLAKHRAQAMTKRMPPDPLVHTHFGENGTDMTLEDHVGLEGAVRRSSGWTQRYSLSQLGTLTPPSTSSTIQTERMKRHGFAGTYRLGIADNIAINGARNIGDYRRL